MTLSSNNPYGQEPNSTAQLLRGLARFAYVLKRRRAIVIGSVVVASLFGTLYFLRATPLYESSTQVLVQNLSTGLSSNQVAYEAVNAAELSNYERMFTSDAVLAGAIQHFPHLPPEIAEVPQEQQFDELRQYLSVSKDRTASIINAKYRSADPDTSVFVVNGILKSALSFLEETQKDASVEMVESLERDRRELEQTLFAKEQELLETQRRHRTLNVGENGASAHPLVERVLRVNSDIINARQRRYQIETTLAALRATARQHGDLTPHIASLKPVFGSELPLGIDAEAESGGEHVHLVEQSLIDDRAELTAISRHFLANHPDVIKLRDRIDRNQAYVDHWKHRGDQHRRGINDPQLAARLIKMTEDALVAAKAFEDNLQQQYVAAESEAIALNDAVAELAIVERRVEMLRNLHETLMDRIANIDINEDQAAVHVAVLRRPTRPIDPVFPNLPKIALFCLALGLGAGIGMVYVLDVLDDRFRSPEELREQLQTNVLAMVREFVPSAEHGIDALPVCHRAASAEGDAFRTLRTTLTLTIGSGDRLAISSSGPGDGKTTVSSNLAAANAIAGKRTLIIDADLRKPGMTKLFKLKGLDGLSSVLRSSEDTGQLAQATIQPTGLDRLDILPAGPKPADPTGLISSERFVDLLAWADANYDQVIVDCPPVLVASDAALVGRLTEGLVLIVQPESNHRRIVLRAVELLHRMGSPLLGVVINRVSPEHDSQYGYGYDYGYGEEEQVEAASSDGNASQIADDSGPTVLPFPSREEDSTDQGVPIRRHVA